MIDFTNLSVIRQNLGNIVYTKTMHEICKEKETLKRNVITWCNIILVALSFASIVLQLRFPAYTFISIFGILFSFAALTLLLTKLSFDPEIKYKQHEESANELFLLRERYISLMADIINEKTTSNEVVVNRDHLIADCKAIYEKSPSRPRRAYLEAQRRLRNKNVKGEDFTFSDEEIDSFLPSDLRYSNIRK